MNIKETFLLLTNKTYPYGHETKLRGFLPKGTVRDKHGNYYYKIGESKTIFACHLDTANKVYGPVVHVIEGNIIKTDGKTILGADDKAGVTVLLYLISKRIPGTYYFFIGEEVGCIGSKAASVEGNFADFDRIVSFDRRDVCSIITHQSYRRTCSDIFATALSNEYLMLGLNLLPDDTGVYTDSAEFVDYIPECTNISVGYYSEHTNSERQDIDFLEKLCEASAQIDWNTLPTIRDMKKKEYKDCIPYQSDWRNRGNRWNNTDRKSKKDRYYSDLDYERAYAGYDESLIDNSVEEDYRNTRSSKRNKKQKDRIETYDEDYHEISKDYYATFREYLNIRSNPVSVFSPEEYTLIEDFVDVWHL
jgi:hypothetical protein